MNALLLIAVQPKSSADADRLRTGLESLMRADPTITVRAGASPGTVVIGAMGEKQLDVIIGRLHHEFGVEANLGRPQVGYLRCRKSRANVYSARSATIGSMREARRAGR